MQKRTQGALSVQDDQRTLALIAWIALLAVIGILGGIQVASFLKSADMDVRIYYDAALALRNGQDMFAPWGDDHPLTYIYPPLFAILFMPFTYLPLEQAAALWTIVNMGLLLGCLWIGGAELLRRFQCRLDVAALPVVMLLATLIFLPRIKAEFDQGQVDFLVLIGITGALVLIRRFPVMAGVLLGVVANIKYQTVIFLPYFLVRGWWSASAGLVGGAIGAALSGALVLGWATNLDYLRRAFSGLGSMVGMELGEEPLPNISELEWSESVSLTSTFARWSGTANMGDTGAIAMFIVAALLCLALGWFLYARAGVPLLRGRGGRAGRVEPSQQPLVALEWAGLLTAAIVFAPQTKMRHFALLLFVILIASQLLVIRKEGVPRWPLLVAVIVMLIGLSLPPGAPEELRELRKDWRSQGGPTWCLLLMYFTALWTGLRWLRADSTFRGDLSKVGSPAFDEPIDQEG